VTGRYPSRDLHLVGERRSVLDLLQSLLVLELMNPGPELWIVSAWVSDIEVVDNRARQFGSICPEWPVAWVKLSHVLVALMTRGTTVHLCVNETDHNNHILDTLHRLAPQGDNRFVAGRAAVLHEKGILGTYFTLDGSMNLTYNGVHINDERLWFRTDPEAVAHRRLELYHRWGVNA
jgi:hypothetical protein